MNKNKNTVYTAITYHFIWSILIDGFIGNKPTIINILKAF